MRGRDRRKLPLFIRSRIAAEGCAELLTGFPFHDSKVQR